MEALALLVLLSAALFYLGSRALITRGIWSLYPPAFARFMDCAACTGFWYGFLLTVPVAYSNLALPFALGELPLPGACVVMGLVSLVLTPVVAGVMQHGLDLLGSAVVDE